MNTNAFAVAAAASLVVAASRPPLLPDKPPSLAADLKMKLDQIDQHPLQVGAQLGRCLKILYFSFCATCIGTHVWVNALLFWNHSKLARSCFSNSRA